MGLPTHCSEMSFICLFALSDWWSWAFSAGEPFIPQECSQSRVKLDKNIAVLVSRGLAATESSHRSPGTTGSLSQSPHPMAKLLGWRSNLPAASELSPCSALPCGRCGCRLFARGEADALLVRQVGCCHWNGLSSSLLVFIPVSAASLTDTSSKIHFLLGMHRFKIRARYFYIRIIYPI